jgi:spoIIIJ-associated protein
MPIPDKLAAANKINGFLQAVVTHGGLRLKYRIIVDPPLPENRDWERPEILVDFAGPDSALLLDRGGELLRSLELLALEMLRLPSGEHEKISFDCQNHRSMRIQELHMAANVAADKVRQTGSPYHFTPMSSRERRVVHLALRNEADLHTESEGEGMRRHLVVYPKDYKPAGGRPAPKTIP